NQLNADRKSLLTESAGQAQRWNSRNVEYRRESAKSAEQPVDIASNLGDALPSWNDLPETGRDDQVNVTKHALQGSFDAISRLIALDNLQPIEASATLVATRK